MKTSKLNHFIVIFATIFFFSCSSEGETPTPTPTPTATSITLTSDKTTFDLGESVSFTVKTDLNEDVTSQATIKANGTDISGSSYTPSTHGNFTMKATYSTFTSNEISITVNELVTVTSIDITSDVTAADAGDVVTFTATANLSDGSTVDKTSQSIFKINGLDIVGNKYIAFSIGAVTATATYSGITSNEISLQVSQIATPATYTKKAVIEDYTGTWCGWCPRVSYAISLVEAETDKVFSVGAHLANGEPMENSYTIALANAFGVNAFPTAFVNREAEWTYPEPNNVNEAVDQAQGSTNVGLAVNSVLAGNTMNLLVTTGFAENVSGTKLVVFILENELVYNQANYTSYYNGSDPIVGFQHNHVLRYAATDVLGSAIDTNMGVNHLYYSIDLTSHAVSNSSKTGVLVMLVDDTGKKVLNAQYASVGNKKSFD
ncbi:MAG: Omp28-related outer membrane protein [Polaribacter sp.]